MRALALTGYYWEVNEAEETDRFTILDRGMEEASKVNTFLSKIYFAL